MHLHHINYGYHKCRNSVSLSAQGESGAPGFPGSPGIKGHRVSFLFNAFLLIITFIRNT